MKWKYWSWSKSALSCVPEYKLPPRERERKKKKQNADKRKL